MNNIQINDRITCIKADKYPTQTFALPTDLVLNRDYICYDIALTPCCGEIMLDIGLTFDTTISYNVQCVCGNVHVASSNVAHKAAKRFIKKEQFVKVNVIKLTKQLAISES